jgi:serine phosphatase RsbU (regulator of sigma subunit)
MFELMRGLLIFRGFADADLARLASQVREQQLDAGAVLFRQGEAGHSCYVVLEGELEVLVYPSGVEVQLELCRPGRMIGEMALIDPSPRSATVRAVAPSRLAVLGERAFMELMHGNPELTLGLLRSSTARLRATNQQMIADMEAKHAEHIRLSKIEEELAVARRIQQLFLPRQLPQPDGWQIAAFNRGAQEIGGDFFDCIELADGTIGAVVADVCGKGVPAALFVALTRSLVRAASLAPGLFSGGAGADARLSGALRFANDYIAVEHGESSMFITLFYGALDPATGRLSYLNAGHNPPLLLGADGRVARELGGTALPLGILPGQAFEPSALTIAPGELLVSFSDGITEALSADGEFYGDDRLLAAVEAYAHLPAQALVEALVRQVDEFAAGASQADDMTILVIKREH